MEVARLLREWKRTLPPPCITDGELRGIRATILPNFRYSTTLAAKMEGVHARGETHNRGKGYFRAELERILFLWTGYSWIARWKLLA